MKILSLAAFLTIAFAVDAIAAPTSDIVTVSIDVTKRGEPVTSTMQTSFRWQDGVVHSTSNKLTYIAECSLSPKGEPVLTPKELSTGLLVEISPAGTNDDRLMKVTYNYSQLVSNKLVVDGKCSIENPDVRIMKNEFTIRAIEGEKTVLPAVFGAEQLSVTVRVL